MYRTYRDPHQMEENLRNAIDALEQAKVDADTEDIVSLYEDVEYWREQVNFAWQDDEADEFGYDY